MSKPFYSQPATIADLSGAFGVPPAKMRRLLDEAGIPVAFHAGKIRFYGRDEIDRIGDLVARHKLANPGRGRA